MTWIVSNIYTQGGTTPPKDMARILIIIINCLRELGEPSTIAELAAYARPRVAPHVARHLERDVAEVLARYSRKPDDPAESAPFCSVEHSGVAAWAFSPAFRMALAESGIDVAGRPEAM